MKLADAIVQIEDIVGNYEDDLTTEYKRATALLKILSIILKVGVTCLTAIIRDGESQPS
jgi:hypothetical protein